MVIVFWPLPMALDRILLTNRCPALSGQVVAESAAPDHEPSTKSLFNSNMRSNCLVVAELNSSYPPQCM